MAKNFWGELNKPILALAPMADVTDAAFRRIIAKYGKPDVMFTEFVSCDGLCSDGKKNLLPILKYSKKERPIVAQVFGANPKTFYQSAKLIKKLGFDGIDINMGCPDKKVLKQNAGAALIKNPKLAQEIIRQTKMSNLPVSVKTRIGYDKYDKKEFKKWLIALLEEKPAAIIIHGRTKKEMSLVPAHWDIIAEAVKTRNRFNNSRNKTLILGNGDVQSVSDAKEKAEKTGVDGIMIGRAIFGNPYLFNPDKNISDISLKKQLSILLEHAKLFEKIFKNKNFNVMKKHFKAYVTGFPGAKELRIKLMNCQNAEEIEKILKNF